MKKGLTLLVKFAVCDDEREMTEIISKSLREYYPGECEIKSYVDGGSLIEESRREHFDAFFLDIAMPGLNGLELAEKIRENDRSVKIIFVSNKIELAHMGYKYGAFRFVRKSELNTELSETVRSLYEYFSSVDGCIIFKTPTGEITRAVKSIKFFGGNGHFVTIAHDEGEDLVNGPMADYEKRVKKFGFIRIHKGYLVNFRYICSIEKNRVRLICGTELPLSRNRVAEVKRELQKLLTSARTSSEVGINN